MSNTLFGLRVGSLCFEIRRDQPWFALYRDRLLFERRTTFLEIY